MFSERLKKIRKSIELTQREVANAINFAEEIERKMENGSNLR